MANYGNCLKSGGSIPSLPRHEESNCLTHNSTHSMVSLCFNSRNTVAHIHVHVAGDTKVSTHRHNTRTCQREVESSWRAAQS